MELPKVSAVLDTLLLHDDMPEWLFQREVIRFAEARGWLVFHPEVARRRGHFETPFSGDKGFPDTVFARGGVVLYAELKSRKGRLSAGQQAWADAIGTVHLWRPMDREKILKALA